MSAVLDYLACCRLLEIRNSIHNDFKPNYVHTDSKVESYIL